MPGRRTDALTKRAVIAAAIPTVLVALAGTLAFAGPAFAASEAVSSTTTMPFPTSICGTSKPSGTGSSASSSASSTPSASAQPSASASASLAKAPVSATPSAASSTAKAVGNTAGSASASPSPSPSASSSASSSSGGFWGWLNGVWQWITGSVQLPPAAAAPVANAAHAQSAAKSAGSNTTASNTTVKKTVQSVVKQGTAKVGGVKQAASGASASPSTSCVPQSAVKQNAASSGGNVAAEIPWHLSTPSMTMYNLTYNGITTIKTVTGSLQVLDFTASKVTLLSMVTFSQQGGGKLQYVDGGNNQTVTLTNVHLWTTSMTANLLGLINVTLTPTSTPTALLGLLQGVTVPLPILFTNVEADNAFLNTALIDIPGFNGHGN